MSNVGVAWPTVICVSRGLKAGLWGWSPTSCKRLRTVSRLIFLGPWKFSAVDRAVRKGLRIKRSFADVVILGLPERDKSVVTPRC
ncbi:hypothetical protein PoB_000841600 [Plakobranchus ocellatus]|uniref:Uncharacterized protein n=1 Tax=Plakobranchus ocellatus TaxID=259542 RepID=A0AAV3YHS6_9GAST|nr:hypothetical protein PoB_000841600 [Plakobranchus ocellatus]